MRIIKVETVEHIYGGRNRTVRPMWLSENPWMVYSEQVNGAVSIACAISCAQVSKSKFVAQPFRAWNKKNPRSMSNAHSTNNPLSKRTTSNGQLRSIQPLQSLKP